MRECAVPNDTYYGSSGAWGQAYRDMYGLQKISAEAAWDICTGSSEIIVAVVDTGLDYLHEDISANVWNNSGEIAGNGLDDDGNGFIDDIRGWNFVSNTNEVMDVRGHGSHCAGTIAGVGNNAKGVVGVTWSCKLMPVQGLSASGSGSSVGLANCVAYAADNGADVISNSWGGPGSDSLLEDAMTYADSLGCVVVVAAGNSNADASGYTPANIPLVITVASTDQNDAKSSFSNWGTAIDVAAPGGSSNNILSVKSQISSYDSYAVGGKYLRLAGTSMACPHVAGLAALILSNDPTLTNDEVEQIIKTSADDLGDLGFDIYYGYGRINAHNALSSPFTPPTLSQTPDDTDGNYIVSWSGASHESGIACYELLEKYNRSSVIDGFESGSSQWTLSGFSISSIRSNNGTKSAFSGSGDDLNSSIVSVASFEITSDLNSLSFWCWYEIEDYFDYAYVDVSTDKATWTTLDSITGSHKSWHKKTYSLNSYMGQRVYIRLRYESDYSINLEGFYLDDISRSGSENYVTISDILTGSPYYVTGKTLGVYDYMVHAKNNLGNWSNWSNVMSVNESATVPTTGFTIYDNTTDVTVFVPFTTSTIEPTITIEVNADRDDDLPGPPPGKTVLSGSSIDFNSDITSFSGPIYITIPFNASDMDPKPYYWDAGLSQWSDTGLVVTGQTNDSLTFTTNHLSIYGIFGLKVIDLENVVIYPNPYKIGDPPNGVVFDHLPLGSTVRIYTIAGEMVRTAVLSGATTWTWDVKNQAGNRCARGIYLYLIFSPDGEKKTGKIAIIN